MTGALTIAPAAAFAHRNIAALHLASTGTPWAPEHLSAAQALGHDLSFLASDGHTAPIAFIEARRAGDDAEIVMLAVLPANRRRGIARRLLAVWLDHAFAAGASRAVLEVNAGNAPACGLYAAAGFEQIGLRKGYYTGPRSAPRADARLLARNLDPPSRV